MISQLLRRLAQSGIEIAPGDFHIPQGSLGENNVANAIRLAFGVAGGVALLIVSIAGFKYVLSQGNPQETAKAKNTIVYALIGLVVCITAYSIVTFVVTNAT